MGIAALLLVLAPLAVAEPFAEFAPSEGWQAWWPAERGPAPFTLTTLPEDPQSGKREGLRLSVKPRANAVEIVLFASPLRSTLVGPSTTWEVQAFSTGPVRPDLWINAMDRRGRGFVYPAVPVPSVATALVFPGSDRRFGWGADPGSPPDGDLNLHEITVRIPASQETVVVRLANLRVRNHGRRLTGLRIRLLADDANGLFHRTPNDPRPIRLLVTGTPMAKVLGEAVTTDWSGQRLGRTPLGGRLDADGRLVVSLPARGPLGLRNVHVKAREEAGESWAARHTYAVFPTVSPSAKDEFEFGLQGDDREKWIHAAAMVGASLFRTGIDFREIRPDPDRPNDFTRMDARIALIRRLGMRPQGLIAYGIPWAAPERYHQFETRPDGSRIRKVGWPDGFIYPVEEGPWRAFVRAVAERYRGQIPIYEIWNEPDITVFYRGTTAEYLAMLRQASEEIRRADPAAKVGTGGFAFPPFEQDVYGYGNPGLQEAVLRDAPADFDVHILHLHGDYASFRWGYESSVLPLRRRLNVMAPVLFNETSFSEHLPERELNQAAELVKKVTYAWSVRATGLVWFRLWMSPQDVPSEYGYSMFRGEADVAEPKAVWPAFAALTRNLRGHRFVREVGLGPGRVAFLFRDATGLTLYHWHQDPGRPLEPVALRFRAQQVRRIDLMGNASALSASAGIVLITPGPTPEALRIEGPSPDLAVLGPLLTVPGLPPVPVDAPEATLKFRLWNPSASSQSGQVSLGGERIAVRLRPGERKDLGVRLRGVALRQAREAGQTEARWSVGNWSGRTTIPLGTMWAFTGGAPTDRPPDLILDGPSQVTPLIAGVPKPDTQWSGPADLSARVWMWSEAERLHLRLDIRDDAALPGPPGSDIWRGDSVQVAVASTEVPGFWEFGAARGPTGTTLRHVWSAPAGREPASLVLDATAEERPDGVRYVFSVPFASLGLTPQTVRNGFRLSLVVNDADAPAIGRKSAMSFGGGMVLRKDPDRFAWIRLR